MSDRDPLDSFASEAGRHIVAPAFDGLVTTSRRRRRTVVAASAVAVVAVFGVGAVGLQSVASDQSGPAHPSPTVHSTGTVPSPGPHTASAQERRAEDIFNSPKSAEYRVVASPDDPDVKAAAWGYCPKDLPNDPYCTGFLMAVAVTGDDFVTARYLLVKHFTDVVWVSGDTFIVRQSSGQLAMVSASGPSQEIVGFDHASPLTAGEILVGDWIGEPQPDYVAVDPQSLTSHPLPIPYQNPSSDPLLKYGFLQLYQSGATTLWGRLESTKIVSSPDGGATWRDTVPTPDGKRFVPFDSGDQGTLAAIENMGSASPGSLFRSTDDGATWQAIHPSDMQSTDCQAQWQVVKPDGNLLMYVYEISGSCPMRAGIYESDSTAWTSFHQVSVSGPGTFKGAGALRSTTTSASGVQRLYLLTSSSTGGLLVSADGGRTWRRTAER